ncbi:hypothetical protein CerSpe_083860 [Prunus speciosa]
MHNSWGSSPDSSTNKDIGRDLRPVDAAKLSLSTMQSCIPFQNTEVDDIVGSSSVSTALPDASGQDGAATEPWEDSSKSDVAELDTSVILSFDSSNEEPYEKVVQRTSS